MDRKEIEAIYPLTPMQEAMLLHTLQTQNGDPGLLQMRCTLIGALEPRLFEEAWRHVLSRHQALRTSVHWEGLDQPLQIVRRVVPASIRVKDWRDLGAYQRRALSKLLQQDRQERLDFGQAPVGRLTLCRIAADRWHLVWTCHHVLLDGWSGALVLGELLSVYDSLSRGRAIEGTSAPQFRDYARWLGQQPQEEARVFWTETLRGFRRATPLPYDGETASAKREEVVIRRQEMMLARHLNDALQQRLRENRVTWNTLLQAVWAVLLSRHTGETDVLFGVTDSGRSIGLPGAESTAGLFINNIPVRVRLGPEIRFNDLLKELLGVQTAALNHAFAPPAQVQAWSDVPSHQRLYESLLVVQNFPQVADTRNGPSTLIMIDLEGDLTSAYPITLMAHPGDVLQVRLLYAPERFTVDSMARLLVEMQSVLERVAAEPECQLATLLTGTESRRAARAVRSGEAAPASRPKTLPPAAAPADALEAQLVSIWQRLLNVQGVGAEDDFFTLGGNSLLVVRLLEAVEQAFGYRLPTALVLQHPTVRTIAGVIRHKGWTAPWTSLVPMQTAGKKMPVFVIHSWTGDVTSFLEFAQEMAPEYPVYGLQSAGLDQDQPRHETVEAMATHYLSEIRSVYPHGPYALVGRCFGNVLALEMAQQMRAEGEEDAHLFIVDSGIFFEDPTMPGRAANYAEVSRRLIGERGVIGMVQAVAKSKMSRLKRRLGIGGGRKSRAESHPRIVRRNKAAYRRYEIEPYPGPATLIRSSAWAGNHRRDWQIPTWQNIALGGLEVHVVPGDHATILKAPYVAGVAAQIKATISEISLDRSASDAKMPVILSSVSA